jgi:integrase
MPRFLQRRRRRWYAVLEIPKGMRGIFGKPRFVKSLETESLTVAERRVLSVVAQWKGLLADATKRAGGSTPDLEAEIRRIRFEYDRLSVEPEEKESQWLHDMVAHAAESIEEKFEGAGLEVYQRITGKSVLLSEFYQDWIDGLQNEPKTIDMKKSDLARLSKKFRFAEEVTPRQVKRWVEDDLQGKEELAVKSVRRMLSTYIGFWNYLLEKERVEAPNPFLGAISTRQTRLSKQQATGIRNAKRKSFSQQDVGKLVNACGSDHELRDLIILAAYTGARIEELCSLKVENVSNITLTVVDAKTEAGWRHIPIHSKIRKLVARMKADSTNEYLFPNLTFNKYQDRSNAIGKRFGRLKKSLGYDSNLVFHSIRKCVTSQLETAGIPENEAARILGHEVKTITYGLYSEGVKLSKLAEVIEVINYPDIRPEHLQ